MTQRDAKMTLVDSLATRAALLAWCCGLGALTSFDPAALVSVDVITWLTGLASHWQWVYALVGLPLSAFALARRRWHILVPVACIVAGWMSQAPAAAPPGAVTSERILTVASANLNYDVSDHTELMRWLSSTGAPDVIVLQEFTEAAKAAVTTSLIRASHPHQVLEASADQFGLALISRFPVVSANWVQPENQFATLKLRAVIDFQGQRVAVTAVHPMPPISAAFARERDASLSLEAKRLLQGGLPGVLAGDLNDTPWSTGLKVTAPMERATSLAPTWPNVWGWLSLLPLDHVLVTPGVWVVHASRGADLHSDHRPVIVQLALPKS